MGTSGTFGGSKSGLVPSWVDEPASAPVIAPEGHDGSDTGSAVGGDAGDAGGAASDAPKPHPPMPAVPAPSGLRSARSNFTRGARASDVVAIRRGAGRYVRASGGGRAAARRLTESRAVARRVARLARSFANQGPAEALRRFDLEGLAGAPAEHVFVALTDVLCPAGATIDEAIARSAMLETVADFAATGVGSFDELSAGDLREFFIGVVTRSIEGKIFNEVGTNAVSIPADIAGVERAQKMLHDFVGGCVRYQLADMGTNLDELDGTVIDRFVDEIYEASLNLIAALGESE